MTVELQAVIKHGTLEVRAYAKGYECSDKDRPYLIADCVSYDSFCREIDSLKQRLEALKPMAKSKFDEFKRQAN